MAGKRTPNDFDELVLYAVWRLGDTAYGVPIRREVEDRAGRSVSTGATYAALEKLEEWGFVSSWEGEATPERGGKAKRFYRIEGAGIDALQEAERARERMREGLPGFPRLAPEGW